MFDVEKARTFAALSLDYPIDTGSRARALQVGLVAACDRIEALERHNADLTSIIVEMRGDAEAENAEARVKEQQRRGEEICCAYGDMLMRVGSLFRAIEHGDDAHRAWLKAAIDKHFDLDAHNKAATALTERLRAAEAVCEAADKEHQSGWSQHDRYACDVCIGIYAWQNAKGEP